MSSLTSLNIKIDRDIKKEADSIAKAMGMTLSTAINVFVRQMVSERAIPFKVQAQNLDADAKGFRKLLAEMRASAEDCGFMSNEEIDAIIQDVRQNKKKDVQDDLREY